MMIYYTEEVFNQGTYGDASIVKVSNLKNQQVDEKNPNWVNTYIMSNLLSDETSVFQFGYS